ncbi:Arsenical pump-driving ATPase [Cystobacter fuscus DSM 2262]|uniref:arsenite-transporting ATPase n=1 Tax=Cystobacter fuscus (strain ATCC 25194 / DSM 2262 / NBRC 100088 / M29) TaxID=1242864 RepID=S9P2W6_CYSF2|nr:ArsA-related P-loop ATPase [Cystobacter fuscus]EPX58810.1 Arsenical pump-driving ATPase [Cystobacter fuscus DSM 2262]
MNALSEALASKRVLVSVGSGGVGKTTISATLALRAAVDGRSSLVCTIDPAKRLANSLGLNALGNVEAEVPASALEPLGVSARARLHAMMLDMKQTWDDLIVKNAPADKREKILANRFYQSLSSALAGSQEYVAMEKLWELRTQRDYELIVLDTPPTAHALDFLEAPNRVLDFLDNEAARWLLTPALAAGKVGLSLFSLGSSYMTKAISRFTGTETLQELAAFMLSIAPMNESFRVRARGVRELLEAQQTGFVLVTSPGRERLDEVVHFHKLLKQNGMEIVAVVVNRVHPMPPPALWEEARSLIPARRAKVEQTLREMTLLAEQDARGILELQAACEGTPLVQVPRFELDVHDIGALWRTGRFLMGEEVIPLPQPQLTAGAGTP